ncbi:MAG: PAS domain S-box protein, partial [Planctomycetes bacterium]|nr:PAS domain S-box protein [Planctomycetota bacterium]
HVARDITERRRAEEEIRRGRDQLETRVQQRTSALRAEITTRQGAESALRESNELLETMFSAVDVLIAYMDREFNFIRVNRAYAAADGREPDFFPGRNHFDLYPNEENLAIFRRVVRTGRPHFTYDKPFAYTENPERGVTYWDWSLQPVRDARRRVAGVVLTLVNVTDRRRAQQQLEMERQRLFSVLNMLPGFVLLVRPDYSVTFVNETFHEIFGDPGGRRCYKVLRNRRTRCAGCRMPGILTSGVPQQWQWADPKGRTFQTWGYPFTEADGSTSVLQVGLDVTARKELEREVLRVSSDERHRIGQDLHDVLGQNLTGVAFLSKVLAGRLRDRSAPEAEQALEIAELVGQSVAQTRAISHGLCPVELKEEGLMHALRSLAGRVEGLFGIPCLFECHQRILIPDAAAATNLYHIVQEAVNNATKHACAKHLWIRLARADGAVHLSVEDDGVGLPDEAERAKGMGLRIMQYRADLLGASLRLERPEQGGTRVVCSFPEKGGSN